MIQHDTGQLLLPLLAEALHPAVRRLAQLAQHKDGPLGDIQLIELERWSAERVLSDTYTGGDQPSLPGWDVLRALGGEIVEVAALAADEEINTEEPLLLTGRFEHGPLFRASFLPRQEKGRWQASVIGSRARAVLSFPQGWPGPAQLTWRDESGATREEGWDACEPWAALVEAFEEALGHRPAMAGAGRESGSTAITAEKPRPRSAAGWLTWQDEVRCLELDMAVRRSVHTRRASALEYQEASEEVSFKGTMTLIGCGLLWGILVLLFLSAWQPMLGWMIVPLLLVFLILQPLRWIIPKRGTRKANR
jgi:hypothetical protein